MLERSVKACSEPQLGTVAHYLQIDVMKLAHLISTNKDGKIRR